MEEEKSSGVLPDCPDTVSNFLPITSGRSRRPDTFFRSRAPPEIPNDMKRRKKVRFCDTNSIHAFSRKLDAPCPSRSTDALNYVPKTSELSSCKKLIEEAGHKQHKEASKLKNIKKRCSAEDVPKTSKLSSYKRLIEEVGGKIPSCQQHNKVNQLKNIKEQSSTKEINNTISGGCKSSRHLLPMENLTPLDHLKVSSPIVKFEEQGAKCGSLEGIFSEKRRDIVKVAAENLSLKVNDFVSKGFDLIPDLLQRLGVRNDPNNHYETLKLVQNMVPDSSYLGVQSGSIPQIPSEDNRPVATILQGQRKLLEHFSDEDRILFSSWRQNVENPDYSDWHTHKANTRNDINTDCLKDSGRMMELFTNTKPNVHFKSIQRLPFNGSFAMNSLLSDFDDLTPEDSYSKHHLMKLPLVPFETLTQNYSAEQTLVPMNLSRLLEFGELYSSDGACNRFMRDKSPKLLGWEENYVNRFIGSNGADGDEHFPPTLYCHATKPMGFDFQSVEFFSGRNLKRSSSSDWFGTFLDETHFTMDASAL